MSKRKKTLKQYTWMHEKLQWRINRHRESQGFLQEHQMKSKESNSVQTLRYTIYLTLSITFSKWTQ